MALEKPLEGPGITRNGDPLFPDHSIPIKIGGYRQTICFKGRLYTNSNMLWKSLQMYQKKGGRSLRETYCKGNLDLSRKQITHKLSGTKGGLLRPK